MNIKKNSQNNCKHHLQVRGKSFVTLIRQEWAAQADILLSLTHCRPTLEEGFREKL